MSHIREALHRFRSRCHQMKIEYYHRKYNNDDSPRLISGRAANSPFRSLRTPLVIEVDADEVPQCTTTDDSCATVFEQSIYSGAQQEKIEHEFYHLNCKDQEELQLVCDVSPPLTANSMDPDSALANNATIVQNVDRDELNNIDADINVVTIVSNIEAALAGVEVLGTNAANHGTLGHRNHFKQFFDFKHGRREKGAVDITSSKAKYSAIQEVNPLTCDNMAHKDAIDNWKKRSYNRDFRKSQSTEESLRIPHVESTKLSSNDTSLFPLEDVPVQNPSPLLFKQPTTSAHDINCQFVGCINKYGLNGSRGPWSFVDDRYSLQADLPSAGYPAIGTKSINDDLTDNLTENTSTETGHQIKYKVFPAFEVEKPSNGNVHERIGIGRLKAFKLFKRHKVGPSVDTQSKSSVIENHASLKSCLKSPSCSIRMPSAKRVRFNSETLCIDDNGNSEYKPTPTESNGGRPIASKKKIILAFLQQHLATLDPHSDEYQFIAKRIAEAMMKSKKGKKRIRNKPQLIPAVKKVTLQESVLIPKRHLTPDEFAIEGISSNTTARLVDESEFAASSNGPTTSDGSMPTQEGYVDIISDYFSSDTDTADLSSMFDDEEKIQQRAKLLSEDNSVPDQATKPNSGCDLIAKPSPFTDRELELLERCDRLLSMTADERELYERDHLMSIISRYQLTLTSPVKVSNISF